MSKPTAGRAGVHIVAKLVYKELGWSFREQQVDDYGIDAQVEALENNAPTGKLIAMQIKAGASYLSERARGASVFRGELKHLDYWLNHQLPVIVVLVDEEQEVAYWQRVSEETVHRTDKGWKMLVPDSQRIEAKQLKNLSELFKGTPYSQRLVALQLDRRWMDLLKSGNRLFVAAEQWVNKSSGRCGIEMIVQDEDGSEESVEYWNYYIFYPGYSLPAALQMLFPWARFSIDENQYFWDEDENQLGIERPTLRPYEDDGEVASWRLEVSLNELGEAFLKMDSFLQDGPDVADEEY